MPFKVGFNPKDLYFVNSIAVLALAALIVLFLIFTIVFSIVKRRGVMVFPFIAWVLCAVAGAEVAANLTQFSIADTSNELGYLALLKLGSSNIIGTLMSILAMVFGFLAAVLALIAFILSIACNFMRKAPKEELAGQFAEEPEPEEEKEEELTAESIRGMIRDELRASQPQPNANTVTGATFGGPLVVQYFNGPAPVAAPAPQPEPKKEEEPLPYVEEVAVPEPYEEPEPQPEPQPEPEPQPIVPAPKTTMCSPALSLSPSGPTT